MRHWMAFAAGMLLASGFGLLPRVPAAQEAGAELEKVCSGERLSFSLPPLELFDEDGDLLISRDEAAGCGALAQMFSRLDVDASDTLTMQEYDGFPDLWRRRVISLRDDPAPDDS